MGGLPFQWRKLNQTGRRKDQSELRMNGAPSTASLRWMTFRLAEAGARRSNRAVHGSIQRLEQRVEFLADLNLSRLICNLDDIRVSRDLLRGLKPVDRLGQVPCGFLQFA